MLVVKCNHCAALTPKLEKTCRGCKSPLSGSVHEVVVEESKPAPESSRKAPANSETHSNPKLGLPWWLWLTVGGILLWYLDQRGSSAFGGIAAAVLFLLAVTFVAIFVSVMRGPGTSANESYGIAVFLILVVAGMLYECSSSVGSNGGECYEAGRYGEYSACD